MWTREPSRRSSDSAARDVGVGLDVRGDDRRPVDRGRRRHLVGEQLAVVLGVAAGDHERGELTPAVVLRERHERPEQHEFALGLARHLELEVVGRDPAAAGAGGHRALLVRRPRRGRGRTGRGRRLLGRRAGVLRHAPPGLVLVELAGVGEVVPAPRRGLHPEQVLRVPQVAAQPVGKLVDVTDERRERIVVRPHDRVDRPVGVGHLVEPHAAVVGVDDRLHRVAHVIEPPARARCPGRAGRCWPAARRGTGRSSCSRRRSTGSVRRG